MAEKTQYTVVSCEYDDVPTTDRATTLTTTTTPVPKKKNMENVNSSKINIYENPFDGFDHSRLLKTYQPENGQTCKTCKLVQTSTTVDIGLLEAENRPDASGLEFVPVYFVVGQERQLMVAQDAEALCSVSPVFKVMFCGRWSRNDEAVYRMEIPDVHPSIFSVILRYVEWYKLQSIITNQRERSSKGELQLLRDDNVWEVLDAANEYQVLPLASHCFTFLLHTHRHRWRSSHLCAVLETAHRLNYGQHYAECLAIIKDRARKVFRNARAMSQLCYDCILELVKADDLRGMGDYEVVVYEAVAAWCRDSCATLGDMNPSKAALRAQAKDLLRYIRWSHITPRQRTILMGADPSFSPCLVTEKEITGFLSWQEKPNRRHAKHRETDKATGLDVCCATIQKSKDLHNRQGIGMVCFVVFLLLLALFAIIYVPVALSLRQSIDTDKETFGYVAHSHQQRGG